MSLDSLNSMFAMNFGCHVSKMVMEDSVNHSSGSKFESGDRHLMREELNSRSNENENDSSEFSHEDSDLGNSELADSEFESNDDDRFYNDDYYESESDDDFDDEDEHGDSSDHRELNIAKVGGILDDNQSLCSNSTILPPLSNNNDGRGRGRGRG